MTLSPKGLWIEPVDGDVLSAMSEQAGGRVSAVLLRVDRIFDVESVGSDNDAWLRPIGWFHDVSTGRESGMDKWVGPMPAEVARAASDAARRVLKLPRTYTEVDGSTLRAFGPGNHWIQTDAVLETGFERPDFAGVRLRMPQRLLVHDWIGEELRVNGCLVVREHDPRIPMGTDGSPPVLWAVHAGPAGA